MITVDNSMLRVAFQMPKMQFRSNAKPSLYAYPEPLKPPKKEEKEKVRSISCKVLWGSRFLD